MDKRRDNFQIALGIVPCLVVSLAALFVVPRFRAVFVAAGVPLPPVTRAVFATFPYWGITALAAVVLWALWPNASSRDRVHVPSVRCVQSRCFSSVHGVATLRFLRLPVPADQLAARDQGRLVFQASAWTWA